jgi:hypothetical protein
MGCNGWNHSPGCTCPWGGDTGGGGRGGSFGAASGVRSPLADGLTWRLGQAAPLESFTIPNAKCPLCGAAVFFYQSPHGGRVFFDDLGPPWPKHQPCTNTYFRPDRVVGVETPITVVGGYRRPAWQGEGWEPLSNVTVTRSDNGIVFIRGTSLGNRKVWRFGTQNSTAVASADGPMFYRPLANGLGRFELAFLPSVSSQHDVVPAQVTVFPGVSSAKRLEMWERALEGDAESQNMVGMILSFHKDTPVGRRRGVFPRTVDWDAAEVWFHRAADQGYWAALNNLGVILLHAYGGKKDEAETFRLFSAAAESLEPTPLRHLADCYADGVGTAKDLEMATYLRELADADDTDKEDSDEESEHR